MYFLKHKVFKCFFVVFYFKKMATRHSKSKRKSSGGRYKDNRKGRAYDLGREPTFTRISERRIKKFRIKAGKQKTILLSCDVANVFVDGKYKKAKIKTILENPANRHFVRRNILTKGAIIETEFGKAKVTSRPGQEGTVNAVIIKE